MVQYVALSKQYTLSPN